MQQEFKKITVFVDEASLVGTRQMHDLLKLSEILKFRVVLIGDTKQLSAFSGTVCFSTANLNYFLDNSLKLLRLFR